MNSLNRVFKRFFSARLKRGVVRPLIMICLALGLVMTTTACAGATQAMAPQTPNPSTTDQDMYPFTDTERDMTAAQQKADRLVESAEQKRQDIQGPRDFVDVVTGEDTPETPVGQLGKSAKEAARNAGKSTRQAAEKTVERAKSGAESLKEGVQDALD